MASCPGDLRLECVDCVYIDFAKAFDSIVHAKLCAKLVYCGISGRLVSEQAG